MVQVSAGGEKWHAKAQGNEKKTGSKKGGRCATKTNVLCGALVVVENLAFVGRLLLLLLLFLVVLVVILLLVIAIILLVVRVPLLVKLGGNAE